MSKPFSFTPFLSRTIIGALLGAVSLLALTDSADAQKAKDTGRIALHQPIRLVDALHNPNPESNLLDRVVMDALLSYDTVNRKIAGQLADSWKQVDDKTIELTLRQGVKWHDGQPVTIDDVMYTFNYVMDPKVNFLFKDSRFGWIDKVEKVNDRTVRVIANEVIATGLTRLTSTPPILPQHVHGKLENKAEFGRKPVGTGPYKVASLDSNMVVLEKNPDYKWGGNEPVGKIGRFEVTSIPDAQTQIAKLMVGELDLVFHLDFEQAKNLQANPNVVLTSAPSISFSYIHFDVADRSGIKVFKDKRVREALLMAIDRNGMRKAFLPKEFADKPPQEAMCHSWHIGCVSTLKAPAYNPAAAKKLLAEAGLADGFDVELLTWGQSRPIAEAVAGDLRKIGVRATVDAGTVNVFQKKRGEGKGQIVVTLWDNGGGQPDVDNTAQFLFADSSRNYAGDPELIKWTEEGQQTLDLKKREDIYRKLFDKVIREHYAMPLVELPAILVHNKDLVIDHNHTKPEGFMFNRLSWK
jgi:peptide/nickel transport system substrate-binding protein